MGDLVMKVKIFKGFHAEHLEKNINDFISDKDVIDIKQSTMESETAIGGKSYCIVVTVMYN